MRPELAAAAIALRQVPCRSRGDPRVLTRAGAPRSLAGVPSRALSELIESVLVDAYGTDEQLAAFLGAFSEEVRVPRAATVLDIPVETVRFDIEGDERRGLVARCGREVKPPGVVALADLRLEPGTTAAWLHAGYRSWLGLAPSSARRPAGWSGPER